VRAALVMALVASGCGVELEHGLDERQANQVAAVLENAGIRADKLPDSARGAYLISVSRADSARAFALLEKHDLPRPPSKGLAETFAEPSLVPSPVEERARLAAAHGAELERTLGEWPGVVVARVHVALPVVDPLGIEPARSRPTASVMLKLKSGAIAEDQVKKLVAGAVPELQPADVTIIAAPAPGGDEPPALDRFGPVAVARGSRTTLAALAGSGLGLMVILSLSLLWAARRIGRLRRRVDEMSQNKKG
jgi:type III secretion protein J